MVIDYIDSLNLEDDHAFVLHQAICGWNVAEWDFTFYSFELYLNQWLGFYIDWPLGDAVYGGLLANINGYIYSIEVEHILVRIHIIFDLGASCGFSGTGK